ncbi:hypothetical protein AB0M46_45365 [Dactylosporangium sp. NPDC051485]|uniref:hypothetical protein n=1 Tax=Dactylosporangium sp. NPDC051485 TaxID=3154846 RepID=UPI003444BA3B
MPAPTQPAGPAQQAQQRNVEPHPGQPPLPGVEAVGQRAGKVDDPRREAQAPAGIYAELRDRLRRYGGGYHNPAAGFSAFNGKPRPGGSGTYAGLSDGYEIYSTDNSRSLVAMPAGNSEVYLSTENLRNPNGFPPGGDYEPALEGHSWFVSRLFTHAIFHSGF